MLSKVSTFTVKSNSRVWEKYRSMPSDKHFPFVLYDSIKRCIYALNLIDEFDVTELERSIRACHIMRAYYGGECSSMLCDPL